jgi:hypothetical protein
VTKKRKARPSNNDQLEDDIPASAPTQSLRKRTRSTTAASEGTSSNAQFEGVIISSKALTHKSVDVETSSKKDVGGLYRQIGQNHVKLSKMKE